MSLGALSREAHETLAIALNRIGGKSNSGEVRVAPFPPPPSSRFCEIDNDRMKSSLFAAAVPPRSSGVRTFRASGRHPLCCPDYIHACRPSNTGRYGGFLHCVMCLHVWGHRRHSHLVQLCDSGSTLNDSVALMRAFGCREERIRYGSCPSRTCRRRAACPLPSPI